MKVFPVLFGAFILGCVAAGAVEAGNCHGSKKTKPTSVIVEQDVTVAPGVVVKETVEVDGAGDVKVTEEVDVGGPGGDAPIGVHTAKKDARKAKRAAIAEAKAERKAARFGRKAADAAHEAQAEAVVNEVYSN
jgi:hypothetical protein